LSDQWIRWCCIDRLNRQPLPDKLSNGTADAQGFE
jgi:hypothetical protein